MSAPTAGVPGYGPGPVPVGETVTAEQTHPDRLEIEHRSLGDLVGQLSGDLSRLIRQEIALAKTEAKEEIGQAGKGAGMLGGAGVAAHVALIFLGLTVVFALDTFMPLAWAALIVTALWAGLAAVLAQVGRAKLKSLPPPMDETKQTLKEDAQWARSLNS